MSDRSISYLQWGVMIVFSCLPLFINLPYKINIYLAWEGAYRMSIGQVPFRDFGMPIGYGFWILPALFFKIFGPYMITLIKTQVFVNFLSMVLLDQILALLNIDRRIRLLTIFSYAISYVFIHFWPWYNHMAFIYELASIYFLLKAVLSTRRLYQYLFIAGSGLFIFLSIFTKQDIGGLGLAVCLAILGYYTILKKDYWILPAFLLAFVLSAAVFILPLLQYDFSTWFNYGQPPHYSRLSIMDIFNDLFGRDNFTLRLYLLLIGGIVLVRKDKVSYYFKDFRKGLHLLLTIALLVQVIIAQVTSYIPLNSHFYYHSIVLAFILSEFSIGQHLKKVVILMVALIGIAFWNSQNVWKYGQRIIAKVLPAKEEVDKYSRVSKNSWRILGDSTKSDRSDWKLSNFKTLKKIYLPPETIEGMERLRSSKLFKDGHQTKVLNMSELTTLAHDLSFDLPTGAEHPLWFHKNVALFDRDIDKICHDISAKSYDVILFEVIPDLNEFYPNQVRSCLKENYILTDSFLAPRIPETAFIEVYIRPID